jgi:hypothetical protein
MQTPDLLPTKTESSEHLTGEIHGKWYQQEAAEYTVPHSEKITIKIFDLYGREIETLVNKVIHPGIYQIEWDAAGLPAGIYLYRMQAGRFIHTKRTLLTE